MQNIRMADLAGLDLNLLTVLRAIGEHRSVTGAARALGVSQPAVSAALSRLRTAMDDPLFVRSATGVAPTKRGEDLLRSLDVAFEILGRALGGGERFDAGSPRREFTIAMSEVGEVVAAPKLFAYAAGRAPGVSFRIVRLRRDYGRQLAEGRVDIVFGFVREPQPELRCRRIFHSRLVCLAREGHPALVDGVLTPEAYLAASHVSVANGHADEIHETIGRVTGERKIALVVSSALAIPPIVAQTDLIGAAPLGLAKALARPNVRLHTLPFKPPLIPIRIYWHERAHEDAANRWLRSAMLEVFRGTEPGAPDAAPNSRARRTIAPV
jgi:DNA-binding transcriptional LysR family regulator